MLKIAVSKIKRAKSKPTTLPPSSTVDAEYRRRSKDDPLLFARGLIIPSASGPKLFESCIAPFQRECFDLLTESLLAVRDGKMPQRRRYWIERTKKASKDADMAICIVWLMAFASKPTLVQVSAANQQQAGIIKRRAAALLHYNPWLNDLVTIQLNRIFSKGTRLGETVIEATGSSGAKQGDIPDLLLLNELVHVDRWGVNETHMNNADGVPRGVVIICTNAGVKNSKAWRWRQNALNNPDRWTVHLWKDLAPWNSPEDMEDARRRDPVGSEFARLWKGQWISGSGDAVSEAMIDKCFRLEGPLRGPETGWEYVAGVDLGISHDHSGVTLVGVDRLNQRIKVGWIRGFEPSIPNDQNKLEVDLAKVESTCLNLTNKFHIRWFGYDPAAGGSFMAQRLRKQNVPMREMSFSSPTNLSAMALAFVQTVGAGKLECYEDDDGRLRRDFGKFSIVPRIPGGYKLEAPSDEWGHADVGTALVICLPEAVSMLGGNLSFSSDDVLYEDAEKLSSKEWDSMPAEMRDICDAYERPTVSQRYDGLDDL